VSKEHTELTSQEAIAQLRYQAHEHLQARQWSQAREAFLALLTYNAQDEDALLGVAASLDGLNSFELLYDIAQRLLEINPNSAPALAYKARALQKMERISEATIANDQALLLDTNLGLAWINRCGLQLLQGKLPEALRNSYRAVELAPNDARGWANKGVALLNFNRLDEALEALDQSLALDGAQLFAIQIKCEIFCRIGRMREVVPLVQRALELNPIDITSLTQGIQALRTLEMFDSLQELTKHLIKIMPDNLFAWENYMRSLRGLGKFEEAIEALDRVIELDPDDVRFWTMKADTLYRLERYREAASIAERARRIDSEYPPAHRIHEKALRSMYQRKEKRKR